MRALFLILYSVGISMFAKTWGYPLSVSIGEIGNDVLVTKPGNLNSKTIDCRNGFLLKPNEFSFQSNGTAFLLGTNVILKPSEYTTVNGNLCILANGNDKTTESPLSNFAKWYSKPEEPMFLFNDSVLFNDKIWKKHVDELFQFTTERDMDDYDYENITTKNDLTREAFIRTGQVGAIISILSLFLHLLIFALMPATGRNLQGYSLACLSIAFIMGYFFFLFGQIPNISHVFCVVTAAFEYFFFVSAYFWMSVIAYDVWRCLRLAIHHNRAPSNNDKKCRFLCYSIYSWGFPFILTIATVTDGFSSTESAYKSYFGRYNICWFTNSTAKNIYFGMPFIMMLVYGTKLFIRGAVMMAKTTIDRTSDPQRTALRNLALYAKLAVVMAIMWVIGMAAAISEEKKLWVIFDALNSFQGLFIFMFYSFGRVWHFCNNKSKSTSADTETLFIIENSTSRSASESNSI